MPVGLRLYYLIEASLLTPSDQTCCPVFFGVRWDTIDLLWDFLLGARWDSTVSTESAYSKLTESHLTPKMHISYKTLSYNFRRKKSQFLSSLWKKWFRSYFLIWETQIRGIQIFSLKSWPLLRYSVNSFRACDHITTGNCSKITINPMRTTCRLVKRNILSTVN